MPLAFGWVKIQSYLLTDGIVIVRWDACFNSYRIVVVLIPGGLLAFNYLYLLLLAETGFCLLLHAFSLHTAKFPMTNKEILLRLYLIIRPYRSKLIISMICMIAVACFTGGQAYLVKDLLDKIFMEKDLFFLKMLPIIVTLVFFSKGIVYYIYTILLQQVGQSIIRDFRIQIFQHLHKQSLSFFNKISLIAFIWLAPDEFRHIFICHELLFCACCCWLHFIYLLI